EIFDEGGKLDINAAKPEVLEKLFMNLGMPFQYAHELVAAIEDWRDRDDEPRLGGAESSYYAMLSQPFKAANDDFHSLDELLLVRGVTPEMFWGGWTVNNNGKAERRMGLVDVLTVATHA